MQELQISDLYQMTHNQGKTIRAQIVPIENEVNED
jgi:hypothetical protein